jgi:hypothetical protein
MLPVLRLFFACQSDVPGVPLGHTVGDLALAVRPGAGQTYPLVVPAGVWAYAVLTSVRSSHIYQPRLTVGVGASARLAWDGDPVMMEAGTDPLTVYILPLPLTGITFPAPGQYELILTCDGVRLDPDFFLEASD